MAHYLFARQKREDHEREIAGELLDAFNNTRVFNKRRTILIKWQMPTRLLLIIDG